MGRPELSITDVSALEGDAGTTELTFRVEKTGVALPATVDFATADDTASEP